MSRRGYSDPYLAGVGIGLVLIVAFLISGRGLGASGAFNSVAAAGVAAVAPEYAQGNSAFAAYLPNGVASPLGDWLVLEIIGVLTGGFLSARIAGRFQSRREPNAPSRMVFAVCGGALMGLGARFAGGCTSGLGLTGGAMLSVGSWIFIIVAFAAAFAVAPLVRRQWL